MRARYISQIGMRGRLRIYWEPVRMIGIESPGGHPKVEYIPACPNSYGKGSPGIHNAYTPLGDKLGATAFKVFGNEPDYPEEKWPTACAHCGAPVPTGAGPKAIGEVGTRLVRHVDVDRLYDSPSGEPEPGDIYKVTHEPGECHYWDNCDGTHLHAILPNGDHWDIDSRANTCARKEDRTHRCWVKTGSVEAGTLGVGKIGPPTCPAGAGSITVPGWHGFLRNFEWTT